MTPRQKQALDFIRNFIGKNGYAPNYLEIAGGIGLGPKSKGAVSSLIHRLAADGHLRISSGRNRSIEVVGTDALESFSTADLILALQSRGLIIHAQSATCG